MLPAAPVTVTLIGALGVLSRGHTYPETV